MEHASEHFEAMFATHFDAVLRFALARAEAEVAKDAAAETFLAAWRSWDRVPAQPRGWLLAVCRRKLADHYRATGRQGSVSALLTVVAEPDQADGIAERDLVRRAFASLRPGDQEVLRLLAWDDLSPSQAAEVLGCSTAIFSVRLHRARRRLRSALDLMDAPARTQSLPVGDAR